MPKTTHILILEDNPADVELMKAELKDANIKFTVTVVSKEREFTDLLKNSPPDLILSDYAMPQFDGISAMKITLKIAPAVPFIIVTGSMDEETAVECMKAGAADYVLKQRISRLGPAVKNALERKHAREQQQQAEDALRESEELFRSLVENISEIFYVVDAQGKVVYGSPNLFASSGYLPEEIIGHSYTRLIAEVDRHRVVDFYKSRTADGSVDSLCEFRAQPKRGQPIWVEQATRIVRDAKGTVIEYRNIARNITDRKLVEEALRDSESRYRHLFDSNPLPMWVFDLETLRFLAVNDAAVKHYGYSREEFLSMTIKDIRPESEVPTLMEDIVKVRRSIERRGVWRHRKKDGSDIFVEITAHGLTFQGREARLVLALDVTERKKAEEMQNAVYRIASVADETKNIDELYRAIHQIVKEVMPAENFFIARYDAEADLLSFPYFVDEFDTEDEPSPPAKPGRGLTAHVLRTGESLLCTEEDHAKLAERGEAEMVGTPSRIWLGVPLQIENKTIGVMAVQHYKNNHAYGDTEKQILEYVSSQVVKVIDRKKTEADLLQQTAFFRQLFEKSPLGIVLRDTCDCVLDVNPAFTEIFQYTLDDVKGRSLRDYIVPKEKMEEVLDLAARRERGEMILQETVRKRKDGTLVEVALTAYPVVIGGKQVGVYSIYADITKRKHAEESLRENEAKLKNIIESSTNLFYAHDVNHQLYFLSPQVKDLLGYEVKEAMKRWTEFASDNPVNEIGFQKTLDAIATGKPQPPYELELFHKSGRKVWVEVREAPLVKGGKTVAIVGSLTDITDRRTAEAVLLESEARFRELFDNAPIGYHEIDANGVITRVNRTECDMLGYTPEEMVGRHAWEFVAEQDASRKAINRKFSGKEALKPFERVFIRKDGSRMPVSVQDRYLINEKGDVAGIRTTLQDITDRKRAEEELLRQTSNFRQLFDSSPSAIALLDEHDNVVDINKAFTDIFQYSLEEVKGNVLSDFILPSDQAGEAQDLAGRYKQGEAIMREVVRKKKNGERVDVALTSYSILIDKTRVGSYRIYQDIGERKKAEKEILRQTTYFRQLFESSPSAIVLVDTNDHVLDINKSFTELFQYTLDEIKGRTLNDCIAPDDKRNEADDYSAATHHGESVVKETVRKRKNGEKIEVAMTGYPIRIDDKLVGVYAMYTDISGRKHLEDQLRQSQKLESIGTLAGGIAHDFNNILGIILGHTTLLERMPSDREKVTASTEAITRATQRGAALVRQLLTFARKADVSIGSVRINDMVKEIKKLLYETFPKLIEVRVQLDDQLPLIAGDATQVHQVLLNLCVNARDAMMPKGGIITIKTELLYGDAVRKRLPTAEGQAYVSLSVSDTGSGMDEATRARIFEPFFTTKELGKGTGLGLSTVYGIIQNHGGLIDVETEVGRGTTF
ncbi:MAG: PAS domain S-box protein [Ignavibacteriae bacterium]|nr:PAS domain S-box protein [Ignavibacteriota bacterium]